MVIMVVGVSAITMVRIQRRAAIADDQQTQARLMAQSAVDIAALRLQIDPNWRTSYTNDTWTAPQTVGDAAIEFKLVDEADGNLSAPPLQPARLYTRATVGDAVRLSSIALDMTPNAESTANRLANGGFEAGVSPWSSYFLLSDCTLDTRTDTPYNGNRYLRVRNRTHAGAGPKQNVTSQVNSGQTYETQAWVRMAAAADEARIVLRTRTILLIVANHPLTEWTPVGTDWTLVKGTATPSWLNLLDTAELYIETRNTTGVFHADDAIFVREGQMPDKPLPNRSTWRREMQD